MCPQMVQLENGQKVSSEEVLGLLCNFELIQSQESYWNRNNWSKLKWGKKKGMQAKQSSTGTAEFWIVIEEKSERGKVVFSLTALGVTGKGVGVGVGVLSASENKVRLTWNRHLSGRNNTNSIFLLQSNQECDWSIPRADPEHAGKLLCSPAADARADPPCTLSSRSTLTCT